MINLKKITKGKKVGPSRVLVYGSEGIGKTRFAAGAPEPFFLDANKGSLEYDVTRVLPDTWEELHEWVDAVGRGEVKCKTLVIDTMGDVEQMCHKSIFPAGVSVADYEGGWGKGDNLAIAHFRDFLAKLETVWLVRGLWVVLVAHAAVRPFQDPRLASYDRFEVSVRPRLASMLRAWCDVVLFATEEVVTQKIGERVKGVSTGVRYVHTARTPAFDAKSRGTVNMPDRVLLSWSEFQKARDESARRAEQFREDIERMLGDLGDAKIRGMTESFLKDNPDELTLIHNRLTALLEEKRKASPAADAGATVAAS